MAIITGWWLREMTKCDNCWDLKKIMWIVMRVKEKTLYACRKIDHNICRVRETSYKVNIITFTSCYYDSWHTHILRWKLDLHVSFSLPKDIIEEMCSLIGVRNPNEQEEYSLYCIVEGDTFTMPLAREEYILDVTTELLKNQQVSGGWGEFRI